MTDSFTNCLDGKQHVRSYKNLDLEEVRISSTKDAISKFDVRERTRYHVQILDLSNPEEERGKACRVLLREFALEI
jgi:hypothetical protein